LVNQSLGVARGVVNNITNHTIYSTSDSEAENNYKIKDVVVGIAGQHTQYYSIQITSVEVILKRVIGGDDIQFLLIK
jgi:cell division protein FtsA